MPLKRSLPLMLALLALALPATGVAQQSPPTEIQLGGPKKAVKKARPRPRAAGKPDRIKEIFGKKDDANAKRAPIQYYVVEDEANAPQIDYYKPMVCAYRPESPIPLHIQCDVEKRECLVAEESLFRVKSTEGEGPTGPAGKTPQLVYEPLSTAPRQLQSCTTVLSADEYRRLKAHYTFKPALLEAPYGYKRDKKGRPAQTHFNLRDRLLVGVHYTGIKREGLTNTMTVEMRSTAEVFNRFTQRRHRFRFLEGELSLAPFEARVTAFEYDYGRRNDEPLFWITTLVGEPQRYDVFLNVGTGITLGRLDYRQYNGSSQAFLDFMAGRLNWEIVQGLGMEDYFMFQIGGGAGTRSWKDKDAGAAYFYPEVGFKAAWLVGERGLWQVSLDGRARSAWELETGKSWLAATASASVEWVFVAVSDQPISLFVKPEMNYLSFNDGPAEGDARVLAGMRLSLFVPPPPRPVDLTPSVEPPQLQQGRQ